MLRADSHLFVDDHCVSHSGQFFGRIRRIRCLQWRWASSRTGAFGIAATPSSVLNNLQPPLRGTANRGPDSLGPSPAVVFPSGWYFCPVHLLAVSQYSRGYAQVGKGKVSFRGMAAHKFSVPARYSGPQGLRFFSAVIFAGRGSFDVAIRKGEQWNCINPACNGEVFVIASSELEGGVNPRCSCGSVMKQPYLRPALKTYPATQEARQRVQIPPGLSLEELGYQHERKYKN